VDETHRAMLDDAPVKSLDFIVHGPGGVRLLVDVKGRRFPGGASDDLRPNLQDPANPVPAMDPMKPPRVRAIGG
jgi:hypothetical protein